MAADWVPHSADPRPLVEAVFAEVAAGPMHGLPLNNPALAVEAVGFVPWQGQWLGVVITPWMMSLMLLPGDGPGFRVLRGIQSQSWQFPGGEFEFHGGHHERLGPYQSCSLYSPPSGFATAAAAREVAAAILRTLLEPERPAAPSGLSRREFLRARFRESRP